MRKERGLRSPAERMLHRLWTPDARSGDCDQGRQNDGIRSTRLWTGGPVFRCALPVPPSRQDVRGSMHWRPMHGRPHCAGVVRCNSRDCRARFAGRPRCEVRAPHFAVSGSDFRGTIPACDVPSSCPHCCFLPSSYTDVDPKPRSAPMVIAPPRSLMRPPMSHRYPTRTVLINSLSSPMRHRWIDVRRGRLAERVAFV